MQSIPLQAIPNQSFSITLDGNQWNFTLKTTNGVISVTLAKNNVTLIENMRAVANGLIIPAKYLEDGNFLFLTQNFQLPDYTQFGVTQLLIYITAAELTASRTPTSSIITVASFSPIAALPLRFAPTGYTEVTFITDDSGNLITDDSEEFYVRLG
jgi:hypothetical protein